MDAVCRWHVLPNMCAHMLTTPSGSVSQPVLHMMGSTLPQLMKLLKQWMDAPTAQTQSTGPGQG